MDIVNLGRSGLKVSRLCMGGLTFGREADEETSLAILDRFTEAGGNFIDTADIYSEGRSEEIIGRWMQTRKTRRQIVLATKVFCRTGPDPNDAGLSRRYIFEAVEKSLRRLQTDFIDLYQIHSWDASTPIEETLDALNDLVHQGKVNYIGCSNLTAWQLCKAISASERNGWVAFISIQPMYNALKRGIETEILPLCEDRGLGVIPYNVLAGGFLTGKYRKGQPLPQGTRLEQSDQYRRRYWSDCGFEVLEGFLAAAKELGVTPEQLALAWVLAEARITAAILGARNVKQLNDTLRGLNVVLSPEERAAIPAAPWGSWMGEGFQILPEYLP